MNNLCPTCGAIYHVAPKDVGRRIKCKKCASALIVSDAGLEVDDPNAPPPRVVAPPPVELEDDESPVPRTRRGGRSEKGGFGVLGIDPIQLFKDFGGFPAVLFGFGAFLVIVFLFQPIIGTAAVERARGAVERVDLEWKSQERKLRKDKKSDEEVNKAREDFYKKQSKDELEENATYESISSRRARYLDMYGMMFGFLFLMAGSLGFLMPGQVLVRRILGTVVLGAQILIIFMVFAVGGGCAGKPGPMG